MLTGILISIAGILMTGYFFLYFSVCAPGSDTVNLGLISDRQNGIIVGIGLAMLGIVIAVLIRLSSKDAATAQKNLDGELRSYKFALGTVLAIVIVAKLGSAAIEGGQYAWTGVQQSIASMTSSSPKSVKSENASGASQTVDTNPNSSNTTSHPKIGEDYRGNTDSQNEIQRLRQQLTELYQTLANRELDIKQLQDNLRTAGEDPKLIVGLQQQNMGLQNEVKNLYRRNTESQNDIQQLGKQLTELHKTLTNREADINRLQNNLRIADEDSKSRNRTVDEFTAALSRARSSALAERRVSEISSAPIAERDSEAEILDERWPNLQDFQPVRYKKDVAKRLSLATGRRLADQVIGDTDVHVHFTIEKDGRPTAIQILSVSNGGDDARKRSVNFIEAAGPFRPLLPPALHKVDVDAVLVDNGEQPVKLSKLEIGALGNRL